MNFIFLNIKVIFFQQTIFPKCYAEPLTSTFIMTIGHKKKINIRFF